MIQVAVHKHTTTMKSRSKKLKVKKMRHPGSLRHLRRITREPKELSLLEKIAHVSWRAHDLLLFVHHEFRDWARDVFRAEQFDVLRRVLVGADRDLRVLAAE